jgi:hypothetical protein
MEMKETLLINNHTEKGMAGQEEIPLFRNPSISGAVESKWSPLRNPEMRIVREWGIGG